MRYALLLSTLLHASVLLSVAGVYQVAAPLALPLPRLAFEVTLLHEPELDTAIAPAQEQKHIRTSNRRKAPSPGKKRDSVAAEQLIPPDAVSTAVQTRDALPAEYAQNQIPVYPEQARRRRQQGSVTLLVDLDATGQVQLVTIERSSGYMLLDRAAQSGVLSWRFAPARIGDRGVPSRVRVPIEFRLGP